MRGEIEGTTELIDGLTGLENGKYVRFLRDWSTKARREFIEKDKKGELGKIVLALQGLIQELRSLVQLGAIDKRLEQSEEPFSKVVFTFESLNQAQKGFVRRQAKIKFGVVFWNEDELVLASKGSQGEDIRTFKEENANKRREFLAAISKVSEKGIKGKVSGKIWYNEKGKEAEKIDIKLPISI